VKVGCAVVLMTGKYQWPGELGLCYVGCGKARLGLSKCKAQVWFFFSFDRFCLVKCK
jgi:hypothetical protein